ncbi:MAG: hypothetical protein D6677_02670 [Calditrichaeota bacterium]|nr:MAG: hypothetical protein D6677_02670 [Calditrichota bacterium]
MKHFWHPFKVVGLAGIISLLAGCQNGAKVPPDMLAQVNDAFLVKDQVNAQVPEGFSDEERLAMKRTLIKKWVENEIVYQTARQEGVTLSPQQQFMVEQYQKSLLAENFLNDKLNKNYRIAQKQIEDYYDAHKQEFVRNEDEVRLIHLFVENRDRAIFKEIDESRDLGAIIEKYYFNNQSTETMPNGDLGYVPRASLPEFLQKKLKRLKTGAISAPIKVKDGYHFIQLLDVAARGTVRDLDLVKNEIIVRLKWEKRQEEFHRLLDTWKQKYQIQTYLSKAE